MIDKVLVSVWLAMTLTILTMAVFLLIIPLYHQVEFEHLCQAQLMRMEMSGGMTVAQGNSFRQALTDSGFQVTRLSAPSSAAYGSDLTLLVEATRTSQQVGMDLTMKEVILSFTFHRTVLCRKIITAAGEP